ncbi:MAG: hypothetical protein JNK85_23430 [Verrucomicrobiales bacterium]|nr:hypothetical protein [Verrucomicrobiales bacterium]
MKGSLIRRASALILVSTAAVATPTERYGVYRSTDRGRTWIRADAGMPNQSRIHAFGSVGESLFAGTDSGVFRSSDEGRSWRPATGAAMTSGRVTSFATLGKRVVAGTDGQGLLASVDEGGSWVRNPSLSSIKVRCLIAHEEALYAGTDADGVFVLDGQAEVQARRREGLPARAQVFALAVVDGRLFAGLYGQGLFIWSDREGRWTKSGPVSPLALATAGRTLIAGHNPGGLHWSADFGVSWSRGTASLMEPSRSSFDDPQGALPMEAPVWELAANEVVALAGASKGVYRSEDHGRTWIRAQEGFPAYSPGVAFLLNRNFVLAGISMANRDAEP